MGSRRKLVTIEHHFADWIYALTPEAYPLEQAKAQKPGGDAAPGKASVRLVRYTRAVKNFDRAIARLKRAKNLATKWQQKVRYYERTLGPLAAKTIEKGKN